MESFPHIMSKKMAVILLGYGIALAGLSVLVQQIAPAFAKTTFITGLAGGGLCVLWSIMAFGGSQHRTRAILTLIAVLIVLLTQVVQAWVAASDTIAIGLTGRLVATVMFLLTMGMLLYLLHGERPPEFHNPGAARSGTGSAHGNQTQTPGASRRQ